MKIQTIFKKSVVFSTVMLLCLLMALLSVPAVAAEQEYAAEVYNVSYDANGNKTETFVAGYDTVAKAFKDAKEDQLIRLCQDANLTLNPHQTYKVDKNGHMLAVASHAGFGAKIVENRDGTVTVSTYKNQGEWYKKMGVAVAGTFGMRFYFSGLGTIAENNDAYLEVKVPKRDKTYEVTKLYKKDFKVDKDGLYYFVVEVAQAQLTDSISFQIVNGSEKGRLRQYAFRDYADQLFAEADKTGAAEAITEAVAPVKKMLNLGAQAQVLFNYNTEDLANKGLYDKDSNPVNEDTITSTKGILAEVGEAKKVETTKITPAEYSLYLKSQTALQFRFIVTDLAEGEIPTAAISYGGNATQKAGVAQGKLNDEETDCWYVSISNIPVKLYDTVFTVTLKCGGETATYSASVLQWINAALASGKPAQKNTATALYQYYLEMKGDDAVVKPDAAKCEHTNTHVEVLKAATCAAAGTSRTVCSDCGYITVANGTITKLENHSYKDYAEVAATCTSDGWSAYTQCTVCGDMNGTTKVPVKATGHSYTSDYTYDGKDVIKTGTCSVCNKTVTEIVSLAGTVESVTIDGTPLDEIGETDSYDWKSKAAATITVTGADGSYAYNIGSGYQAIDGKSFTVPTLTDTVTVTIGYQYEGTEFYVPVATIYNVGECCHDGTRSTEWIKGEGYYQIGDACGGKLNAEPLAFIKTIDHTKQFTDDAYVHEVVTDENGMTYLHTEYDGDGEGSGNLFSGDTAETGQYLVMKLRTNMTEFEIWSSTVNTGATEGKDNKRVTLKGVEGFAVDEWSVIVIDLSKTSTTFAETNGAYCAKYVRLDYFDSAVSTESSIATGYLDVAFVGMCDDLRAVEEYFAPTLAVTTDNTEYAAGETVTATVTVKNNPGFNAMPIALTYTDSEGTVTVVEEYTVKSCATGFTEGATMLVEKEDTTDYTADGELVTLTFAAPTEAGEYEIGLVVPEGCRIVNANEDDVAFATKTATITVTVTVTE